MRVEKKKYKEIQFQILKQKKYDELMERMNRESKKRKQQKEAV
jgi:hypothetical protein